MGTLIRFFECTEFPLLLPVRATLPQVFDNFVASWSKHCLFSSFALCQPLCLILGCSLLYFSIFFFSMLCFGCWFMLWTHHFQVFFVTPVSPCWTHCWCFQYALQSVLPSRYPTLVVQVQLWLIALSSPLFLVSVYGHISLVPVCQTEQFCMSVCLVMYPVMLFVFTAEHVLLEFWFGWMLSGQSGVEEAGSQIDTRVRSLKVYSGRVQKKKSNRHTCQLFLKLWCPLGCTLFPASIMSLESILMGLWALLLVTW